MEYNDFVKTPMIFLALLLSAAASAAAEDSTASGEIVAASSIAKVIVYADRAIVTRTVTADLAAGENRLVFDDLPERTEPNSLQVKGSGRAVLQDTVFRTKFFSEFPDEKIQALLDSKQDKDDQVQLRNDAIARRTPKRASSTRSSAK